MSRQKIIGALRAAFPHTIPVLTGFACLGMAYGVLMQSKGYGPLYSTLMSAVAFCGSMQYVAITLLCVPFDPLQAFFLSLMVNARHLFYGLALLPKYRGLGRLRTYLIYALCDETFSVVSATPLPPGMEPGLFFGAVAALNHFYWVAATFAGGVLGSLTAFDTGGLDFALTALFVVLFLEQWQRKGNRKPALLGVGCAAGCLLAFGGGWFLLPAMGCILAALLIGREAL